MVPAPKMHEHAMLIGWTLKDMGWIVLCAPVAFPAALLAFCAETHLVMTSWREATTAMLVHQFAECCWLLGNTFWMLSEFLCEDGQENRLGRQFPWYKGPLFGVRTTADNVAVDISRLIFSLGLAMLLTFYTLCCFGRARLDACPKRLVGLNESSPRPEPKDMEVPGIVPTEAHHEQGDMKAVGEGYDAVEEPHVGIVPLQSNLQTTYGACPQPHLGAAKEDGVDDDLIFGILAPGLYLHLFIGPWIAKDLCWTFDLNYLVMFFSGVTIGLGIDYVRRFGGDLLRAELLWMIGDTIWAYGEVGLDDQKTAPRDIAAIFLMLALLNIVTGAMRTLAVPGTSLLHSVKGEAKPLMWADTKGLTDEDVILPSCTDEQWWVKFKLHR